MRKLSLLLSLLMFAGLNVAWGQCSDLFFSEYIEGSGNNKALEIFNPTNDTIDLTGYRIVESGNGGAFLDTLDLFGKLAPGDVFVIATNQAAAAVQAVADSVFAFPSVVHYNGDDALILLNMTTGDTLDIIGVVGVDPGTNWPVGTGATSEFTLVRADTVLAGTTDWALSATQWLVFPQNTFDSLGTHSFVGCGGTGPGPVGCTDLFFSEYIEGSGNNKALEVFNPTNDTIDLTGYRIVESGNGGAFLDTLDLFGKLAPGDVFVIATNQAAAAVQAVADSVFAFPSVVHYNGNDALVLLNMTTGDTLDIIGVVGVNPGTNWPVGTGATSEFTLVRADTVHQGTTDWALSATQWLVFPQNTFDSLGAHTMQPCTVSPPPPPAELTNCATDLFFSEYIEGTGNNKALEIFNPLDVAVNLSNYQVHRFNNGTTLVSDIFQLSGTLAGSEVYVVGNPQADPAILAVSDTLGSATFYNGDDALALINTATGDTVDIIGIIGNDPGVEWPAGTGSTLDHTLVRMASVNAGTTDWAIGSTQWLAFPVNTYDSLGTHTMQPCPVPSNCTTDLFFSEYIEGTGNNKALEIFNPLDVPVNLGNYQVHRFNNGAAIASDTFQLAGTLAGLDVYVIGNAQAAPVVLAVSDTTGSATFYNGNDALILLNLTTGDTLDIIGVVGENPGTNWPVGSGSTLDHTLVRMPTVNEGTTDWVLSSTQWIVLPVNTFDSLGTHNMDPCPIVEPVRVGFAPASASVSVPEAAGSIAISVVIANGGADTVAVDVVLNVAASTATLGADFTWNDTTLVFPANATMPITVSVGILDDNLVEGNETIVFDLVNATSGAVIGLATSTITILDDDFNAYPIGLVTADSVGDGLPDSLGIRCQVQGIVHGIDLRGGPGYQLTLIDSTGGINVFSFVDVNGYQSTEGDELIVVGDIIHFNGLAEIQPISITVVSAGNALFPLTVVTTLDETTENEWVTLECVTLLDPSLWPSTPGSSSVNLLVTNYADTFVVRIDSDTDLIGTPAPTGKWLNISGVGAQFDNSFPHLDGYQLLPQYLTQVVERPDPVVSFATASDTVGEADGSYMVSLLQAEGNPDVTEVTIVVDASSTATPDVDFAFDDTTVMISGCGDSNLDLPLSIIDDADAEGNETIVLIITTATNNATVGIDTLVLTIMDNDGVAIGNLLPRNSISLYPNPASDRLLIEASLDMERLAIFNLVGQEVLVVNRPDRNTELGISHLPRGIYTLRVMTAEGLWMQKWVKE